MQDDFSELEKQALAKIRIRSAIDYLEHMNKMQRALDEDAISRKEYIRRMQRLEIYGILYDAASGGEDTKDLDKVVQQWLALIRNLE